MLLDGRRSSRYEVEGAGPHAPLCMVGLVLAVHQLAAHRAQDGALQRAEDGVYRVKT